MKQNKLIIGIIVMILLVSVVNAKVMTVHEIGGIQLSADLGVDSNGWNYYEGKDSYGNNVYVKMRGAGGVTATRDEGDDMYIASRTQNTGSLSEATGSSYDVIEKPGTTANLERSDLDYTSKPSSEYAQTGFANSLRRIEGNNNKIPTHNGDDIKMTSDEISNLNINNYIGTDRNGNRYYQGTNSKEENVIIRYWEDKVEITKSSAEKIDDITTSFSVIDPVGWDPQMEVNEFLITNAGKQAQKLDQINLEATRAESQALIAGLSKNDAKSIGSSIKTSGEATIQSQSAAGVTQATLTSVQSSIDNLKNIQAQSTTTDIQKASIQTQITKLESQKSELQTKLNQQTVAAGKTPTTTTSQKVTLTWEETDVSGNKITKSQDFNSRNEAETYIKTNSLEQANTQIKTLQDVQAEQYKVEKTTSGSFVVKDGNGKTLTSPYATEQQAKDYIVTKQNNVISTDAKSKGYTVENTYNEEGYLIVKDKIGDYFKTEIDSKTNKPTYTKLNAGDEITSKDPKTGLYSTSKINTDGNLEFIGYKTSSTSSIIPMDKETYDELARQKGKDGIIVVTGDIVTVKGGDKAKDKNMNRYQYSYDQSDQSSTITTYFTGTNQPKQITTRDNDNKATKDQYFDLKYFDKSGNVITLAQYNSLEDKDKGTPKSYISSINDHANKEYIKYDYGFGIKNGKITFAEVYTYDEKGSLKSYEKGGYKYVTYDANGDPNGEVYFTNDGEVSHKIVNGARTDASAMTQAEKDTANAAQNRAHSRRIFTGLETILTQYQGLGYYSNWFMDDDDIEKWIEMRDKLFDNFVLGGTDYWTSEFCKSEYDTSSQGTATIETPGGIRHAATVNGERSTPIGTPDNQSYFYKFTFYVAAKEEEVHFNVVLYGDQTKTLYETDIKLKAEGDDSTFTATNQYALANYSKSYYNKICLEFSQGNIHNICNTIVESDYGKDNYINSGGTSTTASSTTTTTTDTYQESQSQTANSF